MCSLRQNESTYCSTVKVSPIVLVKRFPPLRCHILMGGVFERQTKSDHFERVMKIMCTDSEAAMLLNAAIRIYPDIAPEIARYMACAIEP
jgi:hypothetical protein